jgi:hypothetical protein
MSHDNSSKVFLTLKKLLSAGGVCALQVVFGADVATNAPRPLVNPSAEYRVLFLGDSITLHPPKESIQWTNQHGMAASAPERDYVHLVLAKVSETLPGVKVKELIPNEVGWVKGALNNLAICERFQPDFVVVQLGEHEFSDGRLPRLEVDYTELLKRLTSLKSRPIVISTGVWNPDLKTNAPYNGETKQIEMTMARVCERLHVPFASVEDLARDPGCFGYGKARGVQWHPNDKGMQGYAARIVAAWLVELKARAKADSNTAKAPGVAPTSSQ